jgi:hypothetical protein
MPLRYRRAAFAVALSVATVAVAVLFPGPLPVSATRGGSPGAAALDMLAPAATGLTAPGKTPTAVSLSWPGSSAVTFENYTIEVSNESASGPSWSTAAVVQGATTTSAVVSGRTPGSTAWWRVVTNVLLGGASTSNVIEVVQPPVAVLTATARSSSYINLTWTNSATYGGLLSFASYALAESVGTGPPTIRTFSSVGQLHFNVTGLAANTSYSFYVNTSDCSSGCGTSSPSLLVTESNVLTAGTVGTLAVSLSASQTVADVGQTVLFTCSPSGGSAPYSFLWNFTTNGGKLGSGSNLEGHVYDSPGTDYATCQVNGSTPGNQSATISVTVNGDPVVLVSVQPTTVTLGSTVSFGCSASGGTFPYHYVQWLFGDGETVANVSGASVGSSHTYSSSGQYVAQCVVLDGSGTVASASIPIQVRALPAFAWLTPGVILLVSALVGTGLALAVIASRRRSELEASSAALARWIPPAGPRSVLEGSVPCPSCGATNTSSRRTCHACGHPLR